MRYRVEIPVQAVGKRIFIVEAEDADTAWESCRNFEALESSDALEITDMDWSNPVIKQE